MQAARQPFQLRNQPDHERGAGAARKRAGSLATLTTIAWAVVAAVAAWGITLRRASATIARLESEWRRELRHWQDDAARARARAAQLAQDAATWAAGRKQGRDDVITAVPLITAAQKRYPEKYTKPRPSTGSMTDRN